MKIKYVGQKKSCFVTFPIKRISKDAVSYEFQNGETREIPEDLAVELLHRDGPESTLKVVDHLVPVLDKDKQPIINPDGSQAMRPIYKEEKKEHYNFCKDEKDECEESPTEEKPQKAGRPAKK